MFDVDQTRVSTKKWGGGGEKASIKTAMFYKVEISSPKKLLVVEDHLSTQKGW